MSPDPRPGGYPREAGPGDAGFRDPAAERALLDGLDTVGLPLREYGLLQPGRGATRPGGRARPLAETLLPNTRLTGMATMRFTTGLLPRLTDHPGLTVEVSGEPADYREADESLRIAVSTTEVPGDNDWFNFGVTLTVEGREVPFLDVFLALSRGDTEVLLPDGAYFSLDQPELRALARLIDEARSLQELPPDQLRISRYQAGFWDELARWAWWPSRPRPGGSRSTACWRRPCPTRRRSRPGCGPSCGRTSGTARLAHVPVAAPTGRDPGRRHGPGQDPAVPGPDQSRPRAGPGRRPVPDRRPDRRGR